LHNFNIVCLLLCRQEPTCYDEMLKKENHNLHVRDGRCYKLPYDLQSSDRGYAGCIWIDSAREFVDATVRRHQVLLLLQVRSTVNRHMNSFNYSIQNGRPSSASPFNFQYPLACPEVQPFAAYLFFLVFSSLTFICP